MSVVVVAYLSGDFLDQCLAALDAAVDPTPFEVIVVDNACPEASGRCAVARFPSARLVQADENLGFAGGCELGVLHASGDLVCFLNPDVVVTDGWLAPLVCAVDAGVGAAAAVTVDQEGEVVEAGSGVYGNDAPFTMPIVSVARRVVDYASACCVVVRKKTHRAIGGFSPAYWPAYFEDVEWGLRLQPYGGVQVIPASVVLHRVGGNTELLEGAQRIFVKRNRAFLDLAPTRALTGGAAEQIFMIEDRVPHTDAGAGDPRSSALAHAIAAVRPRAEIVWLARDATNADRYREQLDEIGITVVAGDVERELVARCGEAGIVIVARPNNYEDLRPVLDRYQPQALRIYDAESLFHRRLRMQAEVLGSVELERAAERALLQEAAAIAWADAVFAVTPEVAEFARAVSPAADVAVLPHAVESPAATPDLEERDGVVVYGGFLAGPGGPNEDAAVVAARQIAPRLGMPITIVGARPTDLVLALRGEGVAVVADVTDPIGYLSRFRVNLCPLRFGAGLKLRILDSSAAGTPTVMTPCGAEGLDLGRELTELLVAESPAEQAGKARSLMEDDGRWAVASAGVREVVAAGFSRGAFEKALDQILRMAGG